MERKTLNRTWKKEEESIIIPQDALKYILLQRTGYKFAVKWFFGESYFIFRLLNYLGYSFKPLSQLSLSLKSLFFASQIKRRFNKDMLEEYSKIKQFLPEDLNSILDIGCGVAGIDVLMSRDRQNEIDVFLIDKNRIDKNIDYHFGDRGSFYNSLQVSKKLLEANGIPSDRIHLQEAEDDKIIFENEFDVVISLLSWGFHYPVSAYLDEVYKKLRPQGILIIDIRKNEEQEKEINDKFGSYKVISESRQFNRILAEKGGK